MFLYFFPLIAAVLGYLFNSLIVIYLTRKAVPARLPALADGAGKYAGTLIDLDAIAGKAADPENLAALQPYIEQHIDVFLKEKLKEKMPAIAMFVGEKTMDMMKKGLMEEIELLLPNLLQRYMGSLKEKINVEAMVTAKIKELPPEKIDTLLQNGLKKEWRMFKWAGAVSGLVIGLVLCLLLVLIP
jgi:uncharacterized membrane protein YheB (UPF0754 family)